MTTYLDRYLAGEHERVWEELLSEGAGIREDVLYVDALNVAHETMRRVSANCQTIVARLSSMGYRFDLYPDQTRRASTPFKKPLAGINGRIDAIERWEGSGPVPLSLRAFWEIVGQVDLIGFHPGWPRMLDPLVVDSPESAPFDHKEWISFVQEGDPEAGPFRISLAPDVYHKDNYSGGEPYAMAVPNPGIDGLFEFERHETTFVNYLRLCFRYGGFLGIEALGREAPAGLLDLGRDLLPL